MAPACSRSQRFVRSRAYTGALVLLALLAIVAPSTHAHESRLQSTTPADGARVSRPITHFVARYSGPIGVPSATVVEPDGDVVETVATRRGSIVRIAVDVTTTGRYEVRWRMPQADGHSIAYSSSFTATDEAVPPRAEHSGPVFERLVAWLVALLAALAS